MGSMLKDRVVIVTGSGRGIGRDIALAMAAQGAKVVVNDPGVSEKGEGGDAGPAAQVVEEIRRAGGSAVASIDSVAEWESANRIVKTAVDAFGTLHAVVNNAGILRDRIFHNMSVEEWKAVIDVHLHGSFYVARAAAAIFRSEERGAFVHMTSTSGLVGNFGQANYAAAKLGIVGLSKSIALDMARFRVRSNCISPFAWSRLIGTIPADTPEQQARVARMQAMETAKIAPLAVYLCSDEAARVSGQIFAVRANEIFLMGQSRPLRSVHRGEGWTPETVASHAIPAMEASFYPLARSADVFNWDPI
jgi:NAD(P)-dependent dehydrogenase (short-subunit alcohol dehydrogenase family)